MMHILSIDRGSHNIGLAYTLDAKTIFPLGSISNDSHTLMQIASYLHIKKIECIVVGIPSDPQIRQSIFKFVTELKTILNSDQTIDYQDENFSTIQAMTQTPIQQSKNAQDTLSAMTILYHYCQNISINKSQ